jgi:hypothetical protein
VDIRGHLRIWDFESLTILYHVLTPNHSFSLLHFTPDSLGLLHVSDHEFRVWAPSALVRKTIEEEASFSDQSPLLPVTEGQFERFLASKVRCLTAHSLWPVFFAGNHNGEVSMYQSSGDYVPSILYTHEGNSVRCLTTSKHNVIASADIHANIQVRFFDPSQRKSLQTEDTIIAASFSSPVTQLLFDASGMHLLVSTMDSDYVYNIEDQKRIEAQGHQTTNRLARRWFVVTELIYRDHFLLVMDGRLMAYPVEDFSATPKVICELSSILTELGIKSLFHLPGTSCVLIEAHDPQTHVPSTSLLTLPDWGASLSDGDSTAPRVIPSNLCAQLIGASLTDQRIIFLHPTSWTCSMNLKELESGQYTEHFFVPEEFNSLHSSLNSGVNPVQTCDGDFAFCMYDKVVVFKGGLKFQTQRAIT